MIQFEKDIEDSEIRIIGSDSLPVLDPKPPKKFKDIWRWLILGAIFIIIIIITLKDQALMLVRNKGTPTYEKQILFW